METYEDRAGPEMARHDQAAGMAIPVPGASWNAQGCARACIYTKEELMEKNQKTGTSVTYHMREGTPKCQMTVDITIPGENGEDSVVLSLTETQARTLAESLSNMFGLNRALQYPQQPWYQPGPWTAPIYPTVTTPGWPGSTCDNTSGDQLEFDFSRNL